MFDSFVLGIGDIDGNTTLDLREKAERGLELGDYGFATHSRWLRPDPLAKSSDV